MVWTRLYRVFTDDVGVDLHLSVLLSQLESLIVTVRQNQEVDGRPVVVQAQEEPATQKSEANGCKEGGTKGSRRMIS